MLDKESGWRCIKDKAYVNLEIDVLDPGTLLREIAKTKRIVR